MSNDAIKVNNLRKDFAITEKQFFRRSEKKQILTAVDDVSFSAKYGEVFCLLGANGAGKTTTLRMLAGLIVPSSGDIIYDNDVTLSKEQIRNKITFLTTELKLDRFFSAKYLFQFYGEMYGLDKHTIISRREYLFNELGVTEYQDKKISELSTGMQQKVSIAISLVNDPQIIIYDEPTNGLDIVASAEIARFLIKQKEMGKCIILSTHIFDVVRTLADSVAIMFSGKIKSIINADENGKYNGMDIDEYFFTQYGDI